MYKIEAYKKNNLKDYEESETMRGAQEIARFFILAGYNTIITRDDGDIQEVTW